MLLPKEIYDYLEYFLTPRVIYSKNQKQYFYNNKCLFLFNEEYFQEETSKILININHQLQNGKNNEEFLDKLFQIITKNIEWAEKCYPTSLDHFNTKNLLIKEIENFTAAEILEEPFTLTDIISNSKNYKLHEDNDYSSYTFHMQNHQKYTDNFANPHDFEKSKVIYVYNLLKSSLSKIENYLFNFKDNFEYIDFENYDYKSRMITLDLLLEESEIFAQEKGDFNLSKVDVANLFLILKEENILRFSKDHQSNNLKINRFIERNFTYKNEAKIETDIKNINKEFTKIVPTKGGHHLKFLNEFIEILIKRKKELEK